MSPIGTSCAGGTLRGGDGAGRDGRGGGILLEPLPLPFGTSGDGDGGSGGAARPMSLKKSCCSSSSR